MEQLIERERWEIKKIGLLNYWWYDEEEFEFADGRLILRGTNGSGKSVTMQSFIPLLLDGNKSPERLDPFNTKARKIEDYILGYGEDMKEENTSYLYMELYKKEIGKYITIGMGLRAKKNNPVSFWGFVIKDGRRIGKDFLLYKDMGNKIPLSKLELKNRIGTGGQVVETTTEYANLVNENIFGFETLSEYQEFIKLLIEIRTPKLSKDGFKPSIITEIMSNSLRGLSDDDLQAVSESIENMNKTKEHLESLNISSKALKQIITPYENYNKRVIYDKAKKYIVQQRQYTKSKKEFLDVEKSIKLSEDLYQEKVDQQQNIASEIETYKYKEKELKSNELWQQKEKQFEMEERIKQLNNDLNIKTKVEEDKKLVIIQKENENRKNSENYSIYQEKFETIKNEMEQVAKTINYDEYFFKMDEININEKYNYSSLQNDLNGYIVKIESAKKALENEKYVSNEYEESLAKLDKVKKEKTKQDELTDKARNELQVSIDVFVEEIYKWEKENTLLKVETDNIRNISEKVQNFGEGIEYGDIQFELSDPYNNAKQIINKQIANKDVEIEDISKQIDEIKIEIEEWKKHKEPEPVRSKAVEENRKRLIERNIPFIELYNAVDFKYEINQETKDAIESALYDMGILDALIIPKDYYNAIKQIDINFTDKYLFEKPSELKHDLTHLLDVKLPEQSCIKQETVYNILKSIMIEDKEAYTYVNDKGEYKIGILEGCASRNERAKYIGAEARRNFKKSKIEELEKQSTELTLNKEKIELEINQLNDKLLVVKEEYKKFPNKEKIEKAYSNLRANIIKLEEKKKDLEDKEIQTKEKYNKLKLAKEETKIQTAKLSFNATLDAYSEAFELVKEFKEYLHDLEKYHQQVVNEYEKINIIESNIEDLKEDLDNALCEIRDIGIKLQGLQAKVDAIKQMLEDTDIEKQMQECMEMLEKLPRQRDILVKEIGGLEAEIRNQKENRLSIVNKLSNQDIQVKISREIFKQELDLKYIVKEYDGVNVVAEDIVKDYSFFEKDPKTQSNYYEILVEKYKDNEEKLLDYNLSIISVFETKIEESVEEIKELQRTRLRHDITCYVNGRKVDLNALNKYIEDTIEETSNLVDEEDKHLFEEILIGAVGRKIRERIYFAKSWVESMNKLMKSLNTSSHLSFSLNWKPKVATQEDEIDTKQIVDILNSDSELLSLTDIKKVSTHFRAKFAKAEKEFKEKDAVLSFYSIIKNELDYRKWFEFQFMYKKGQEQSKELTNNAFFKLSGGEKAMAMYIPLFASVCARYQSAKDYSLRIISLDEAFAGVDDNNIRDMFRILTELDLEYIINSQMLWGEYDTVPSLAIDELISDASTKVVSVIRYHWNGQKRELISKE